MTEDEMVGWHHRLNGHGFEQILRGRTVEEGSGGERSLACCSPWGHIEQDATYRLNNNSKLTKESILEKKKQGGEDRETG